MSICSGSAEVKSVELEGDGEVEPDNGNGSFGDNIEGVVTKENAINVITRTVTVKNVFVMAVVDLIPSRNRGMNRCITFKHSGEKFYYLYIVYNKLAFFVRK